jgi:uncharacterized Zn-finger protein
VHNFFFFLVTPLFFLKFYLGVGIVHNLLGRKLVKLLLLFFFHFYIQASLKQHSKIHVGQKNFVCEICQKAFLLRAHLTRHYVIHTGQKDYTCLLCNKQFTQASNLKQHMVSHTHQKDHKCKVSCKSAKRPYLLGVK